MKRSQEKDFWHGKIKYKKDNDQDYEEDIEDPADVEKRIREGRATLAHMLDNSGYIPYCIF